MGDEYPLEEEFIIDNVDALKMIADPLRLKIMRSLEKPCTVKDLAAQLDIPATKLYYHVNQLESHNIIRVVDTRIVSGIIEKHYQVTAKNYHVSRTLLKGTKDSQEQLEVVLSAIFDSAKAELRQSIQSGLLTVDEAVERKQDGLIWHGRMDLSPELFAEFHGRFKALLEEFDQAIKDENHADTAGANPFGLVVAFYPIAEQEKSGK